MGTKARDKFISISQGEVGYTEGSNNWTKYAQYFDTTAWQFFNGKKQNVAWCSLYLHWVFCQLPNVTPSQIRSFLGEPSPANNCAAGVPYFWNYLVAKGWKVSKSDGQAGDIIFLNDNKHVGHIEYVDGNTYHTIEGNKNNKVSRCTYSKSSSSIYGICRPDWSKLPDPEPGPTPPTPPTPTPTNQYTVKTNSGDALRLRAEPNTSSKQVGWIDNGTTFTSDKVVEGESIGGVTTWVYYNGGYATGKYLDPTPVMPEPTPTTTKYKVQTKGGTLSLRNEPKLTGSTVIANIPNGTVLDVSEVVKGESVNGCTDWAHTKYDTKDGYCTCSWLVKVESTSAPVVTTPAPSKPSTPSAKTYTVKAKSGLNVRRGPGKNYGVVTTLANGSKVTVYETKNGWGRIGADRWCCMTYLK